jgi:hypothetical protein
LPDPLKETSKRQFRETLAHKNTFMALKESVPKEYFQFPMKSTHSQGEQ